MTDLLQCPKCGWIHFGVSEKYVQEWEKDWKKRWKTMSKRDRAMYGCEKAPPSREEYLHCFRCGNSDIDSFHEPNYDFGDGHTIQPILNRRLK